MTIGQEEEAIVTISKVNGAVVSIGSDTEQQYAVKDITERQTNGVPETHSEFMSESDAAAYLRREAKKSNSKIVPHDYAHDMADESLTPDMKNILQPLTKPDTSNSIELQELARKQEETDTSLKTLAGKLEQVLTMLQNTGSNVKPQRKQGYKRPQGGKTGAIKEDVIPPKLDL